MRGAGREELPGAVLRVGRLPVQQLACGAHHACSGQQIGRQLAQAWRGVAWRRAAVGAHTSGHCCQAQHTRLASQSMRMRSFCTALTLPGHLVSVPQPARPPGVCQHVCVLPAALVLWAAGRGGQWDGQQLQQGVSCTGCTCMPATATAVACRAPPPPATPGTPASPPRWRPATTCRRASRHRSSMTVWKD